jgi:peptidyl-dipeptidase Dcp
MILSRGGSQDALELFKAFYGGDPDIAPLLERRGLVADGSDDAARPEAGPVPPKQ